MYIKVTDEEVRLMNVFKPFIKKLSGGTKLADDAPEEAVAAYQKFMEITKDQYED